MEKVNNFCPNCGKKIDSGSNFCPYCGANLVSGKFAPKKTINNQASKKPIVKPVKSANISTAEQLGLTRKRVNSNRLKKHKRIKTLPIVIAIIVLLIAGTGLAVGNYFRQEAELNSIPKDKLAGLAITYAHVHYPQNEAWKQVYRQAFKGNVSVAKRKHYEINGIELEATKGNSLYVINDKVAYTIEAHGKNSQSDFILSDGKKNLGTVNVSKAYHEVKQNHLLDRANKISARQSTAQTIGVKQLGVLVGANYLDLKSVKFQIDAKARNKDNDVWGYNSNGKLKGYYWIHLGLDGASEFFYRLSGNKVIVKRLDVEDAPNAASAKMITEILSLNKLIKKYYATSNEKETIDQLARKMKVADSDVSDSTDNSDNDEDETDDTSSQPKENKKSDITTITELNPKQVASGILYLTSKKNSSCREALKYVESLSKNIPFGIDTSNKTRQLMQKTHSEIGTGVRYALDPGEMGMPCIEYFISDDGSKVYCYTIIYDKDSKNKHFTPFMTVSVAKIGEVKDQTAVKKIAKKLSIFNV